MGQSQIKFYYKNIMDDVIGAEHGISRQQLDKLAAQTIPVIKGLNARRLPYRELPYKDELAASVKKMASQLEGCENFVVLGIGGSALGNIALQTALNPYMYNMDAKQRRGPRLFVFDNVDPQQLGSFLDWVGDKLDKTIFNVISKSGRTAETASQFLIIREMLLERLGSKGFKDQVVATTDAKAGTLRQIVNETGLRSLEVPDGVGGRFSVLSAVGLLSATVCGIDIDALMAGARQMDEKVGNEDFYANPAALYGAIKYHYYGQGKKNSVMMSYSYALKDLADWYRQLWAESLGKAKDLAGNTVNIGPTPINAIGTTDQHSQVQLYREGPNDKVFTFLEVADFGRKLKIGPAPQVAPELGFLSGKDMGELMNAEKKATEYALIYDKRPCITMLFEKIDEHSVGQFIYLYEVTTSVAGKLFGINTYDQPAVELGKDATFALMGKKGTEEMARKIEPVVKLDEKYLV